VSGGQGRRSSQCGAGHCLHTEVRQHELGDVHGSGGHEGLQLLPQGAELISSRFAIVPGSKNRPCSPVRHSRVEKRRPGPGVKKRSLVFEFLQVAGENLRHRRWASLCCTVEQETGPFSPCSGSCSPSSHTDWEVMTARAQSGASAVFWTPRSVSCSSRCRTCVPFIWVSSQARVRQTEGIQAHRARDPPQSRPELQTQPKSQPPALVWPLGIPTGLTSSPSLQQWSGLWAPPQTQTQSSSR
jgi:hypothetical protein